jgi:hypothetical protein
LGRSGSSGADPPPVSIRLGGSCHKLFPPCSLSTHLSKLGDIDQSSQVLQIRTLVVEPTEVEVLSGIPVPEGYEDIR